eukprot:scaffold8303_cov277-Pinguiococcus_pyrenoidosus.AAC.3
MNCTPTVCALSCKTKTCRGRAKRETSISSVSWSFLYSTVDGRSAPVPLACFCVAFSGFSGFSGAFQAPYSSTGERAQPPGAGPSQMPA